jgi:hypothetical protein
MSLEVLDNRFQELSTVIVEGKKGKRNCKKDKNGLAFNLI